jgi:hypothetical protein
MRVIIKLLVRKVITAANTDILAIEACQCNSAEIAEESGSALTCLEAMTTITHANLA